MSASPTLATVYGDGRFVLGGMTWRAAMGQAGIAAFKQEGDGATPSGLLPLRRVLYRADRLPRPRGVVPMEPIAPQDGWCDDPTEAAYNRQVRLPHAGRCEILWRDDGLYDVVGVLGWNDDPVVRGRGSAIFLHVAGPGLAPTAGCVALSAPDLLAALAAGLTGLEIRG